jgi:hypothetical protein
VAIRIPRSTLLFVAKVAIIHREDVEEVTIILKKI